MIHSTSKKIQPQRVNRSEVSLPTPFVFDVMTKRSKWAFKTDASSSTENLTSISSKSLHYEKHGTDIYSNPLIREHYDSCLHWTHHKTCESIFADVLFTKVSNPVKNIYNINFSKTKNSTDVCLPICDVLEKFLNKLQDGNDFLTQPRIASPSDWWTP